MGEGDKRQPRPVVRYGSRELARGSAPPRFRDGDARVADRDARATDKDAAAALVSRTATVDDPLTTVLLAEASRRTMTIDVSPEQIDQIEDELAEADHPPPVRGK